MAQTKEISRRIKSVTSTKKITKAMEMVAAAKMRRAIEAVLKTRAYANLSWETVLRLAALEKSQDENTHPLLAPRREIKTAAVILITSNRGMCGGYNSAVVNKAEQSLKKHAGVKTNFILAGRKGASVYQHGHSVIAEFEKSDILNDVREINPIIKMAVDDYLSGKYDKIFVAYTDFVNPAKQIPRVKQLLPVELEKVEADLGSASVNIPADGDQAHKTKAVETLLEYTFEPSPREVLDTMIPRLLEIQLFQAFLEANASEHSARMTAMHQATEAASDMVSELTLFYNKARQAGITAEIAEISAGANALAE
ncbi:MAG: ATP synthase F1 subunit gamma [Patescibacteria group bacterium]|jgi:F-type H+-transporting ATPase subunit gamma